MLVLDEGDEMLDRGFAPDVERIIALRPEPRQTALFSATLPAWVAGTAAQAPAQRRSPSRSMPARRPAPEIEHVVYDVEPAARLGALRHLLDRRGDESVIVFGRTKHGVKKLAQRLVELGYPSAALQGNLSQNARERVMADFRSGRRADPAGDQRRGARTGRARTSTGHQLRAAGIGRVVHPPRRPHRAAWAARGQAITLPDAGRRGQVA